MRTRALIHLAAATVAAAGAFSVSVQVGRPSPAAASGRSEAAPALDARQALEQGPARATGTAGTRPAGAGHTVVDESTQHSHVVDPWTGGLVSVAGASGTIPKSRHLGPMHEDPLPAGVSLHDPTDTGSLLERAGVEQAALAASSLPVTAGATAPVGTPGIATLGAHVAPSCSGTGTDGKRVQVLYVHEASTPSRYADVLPVLRNEVANVDDVFAVSSEQTGGGRRVRWVHDADCPLWCRTSPCPTVRSDRTSGAP